MKAIFFEKRCLLMRTLFTENKQKTYISSLWFPDAHGLVILGAIVFEQVAQLSDIILNAFLMDSAAVNRHKSSPW